MAPARSALRPVLAVLPALALCGCAPHAPAAGPAHAAPPETAAARDDVALLVSAPDASRTIDRVTAQYARFVETLMRLDPDAPVPDARSVRDTLLMGVRNVLYRRLLQVPADEAVELAAPLYAALLAPRDGDPGFAATVPLRRGSPARPHVPRRGRDPDAPAVKPLGDDRLALGYNGAPPLDLAATPGAAAPSGDDLVLQFWGEPGAARLRSALLGRQADQRLNGGICLEDDLLLTVGNALLDGLGEVAEAQAALHVGEPGEPALAVRLEVTPAAGSTLAAIFPPEAGASGEFPFLGAVPAGARTWAVSRTAPGDDVLVETMAGFVTRLFEMFERQACRDLAAHVAALGSAAHDLVAQLDGAWLDAAWAAPLGAEPAPAAADPGAFLSAALGPLPSRTVILGVHDAATALDAARRACTELEALGADLDAMFGGPLDISCRREVGAAGDAEIDALALRQRIERGDLESGRRPFAAEVHFAAAGDRLVVVTGDDWSARIVAALADGAPDGGLAADPHLVALRSRLPDGVSSVAWIDVGALLGLPDPGHCVTPPGGWPELPLTAWTAVQDGHVVASLETAEDLAEQAAALAAEAWACGVQW